MSTRNSDKNNKNEKIPPSKQKKSNSMKTVGRKKGAGTGLNDWFIIIFAVAFALSFSLNLMHLTMGSDDIPDKKEGTTKKNAARLALHRAMKGFKDSPTSQILRKQQQNELMKPFTNLQRNNKLLGTEKEENEPEEGRHLMRMAELDCKAYGGPSLEDAQEMVYWQDIPSDSLYVSPFFKTDRQQKERREYLTFEPDGGGWNNIRMAMESTIALSVAMGRTLVMPPQKVRLVTKKKKRHTHVPQHHVLTFNFSNRKKNNTMDSSLITHHSHTIILNFHLFTFLLLFIYVHIYIYIYIYISFIDLKENVSVREK
jgi:hypothetical protein